MGLLVLVAGGVSLYSHLVTAPALLSLPVVTGRGSTSGAGSVDGVWNAGAGSVVGWRAEQVLLGQQSPLYGRTGKVWGSLTISAGSVTQGSFGIDMAAVTSDLSQSTQSSVFDVKAYPTASLLLTAPIALGPIPAEGAVEHLPAAGTLTLHGVSRGVHFTASVERAAGGIEVLADLSLPFADWGISVQGVPWLADIQSPAALEVLLALTQGGGNAASAASWSTPGTEATEGPAS